MRTPILAAALLLLSACSNTPPAPPVVDTVYLLSGRALLGHPVRESRLPDDDILGLTPEIRDFLARAAPGGTGYSRLGALVKAFEEGEFSVAYEADSTLTAAETYHQRRGNCLAFTAMMVAMARELGADAYFNLVDVPPVWGHDEAQTFMVYRHVNMVSENPRGRRVVDFNLAAYDPVYDQRRISDSAAFALYHSNRAVELMHQHQREEAFLHIRKALQLRPQDSDLWANLGALYSRFGHTDEAEQGYHQALLLRPGNLVAISNLERLYRASGRTEIADHYAARARFHRNRNPYHLYYQARDAYEQAEYQQAQRQLRRALRQHKGDHRFHFLMGLTSYRLGEMKNSREHFTEAFSLAENPGTKHAYLRKLELLQNAAH